MLGLDQYCGYIGKINDYVKGSYKYQYNNETIAELSIEDKFKTNSFNNSSWVELFFNSDVHIAGFTFSFSEIDLWWLITRRARMKKSPHTKRLVENNIHFYCDKIEPQKKSLLESLFVKVHVLELTGKIDEYLTHYKKILTMI